MIGRSWTNSADTYKFEEGPLRFTLYCKEQRTTKRSGYVSMRGIGLNRTTLPLSRLIGLPTTVWIEQRLDPGDRSAERERLQSSKEVVQRYWLYAVEVVFGLKGFLSNHEHRHDREGYTCRPSFVMGCAFEVGEKKSVLHSRGSFS